jgi:hypothetical protein
VSAVGNPAQAPLPREVFDALPAGTQDLYEHWVQGWAPTAEDEAASQFHYSSSQASSSGGFSAGSSAESAEGAQAEAEPLRLLAERGFCVLRREGASAAMEAMLVDKALQDILLAHLGHHYMYHASRIGTELGPTSQRGWPHAAGLLPTVGGAAPELVAQLPLTLSVLWAPRRARSGCGQPRTSAGREKSRQVAGSGWHCKAVEARCGSSTAERCGGWAMARQRATSRLGAVVVRQHCHSSVLDDGSLARRNADAALPTAAELVSTRDASALGLGDHDPALLDLFEHWPAAASTEVARL